MPSRQTLLTDDRGSLVANTATKPHAWHDWEADKKGTRGSDAAVKLHLEAKLFSYMPRG